MSRLKEWVLLAREKGASDLHLECGTPLVLRIRGELLPSGEKIPSDILTLTAKELLDAEQWQDFLNRRSADLSKTVSGTRCRINVFQSVRGLGMAIRILSSFQNNLDDCNLHPELKRLVASKNGLIVISGATGSGKSTTLAALIEEINLQQRRHIIAVESPIEYFFNNKKSFIRQREVPTHTPSFEQAITDSMRENPDVLVIGEMRTPDVMRLTLNAAETGHLVLATMHSSTCAEALARICMSFPAELQSSIRAQLADCLVGVICQKLNYLPQFQLQVPHCEILLGSSAAKSNIRSGQFSQILSVIQSGGEDGMWSFDRYQRWMEQKKSWVRPSQAIPLDDRDSPAGPSFFSPGTQRPAPRIPTGRNPIAPTRSISPTREKDPEPSQNQRIEIAPIEEDLEELAQKILKTEPDDEGN